MQIGNLVQRLAERGRMRRRYVLKLTEEREQVRLARARCQGGAYLFVESRQADGIALTCYEVCQGAGKKTGVFQLGGLCGRIAHGCA